MILSTLARIILVPIAFVIAAATAGAVAVFLGLQKITVAMAGKDGGAETLEAYWELAMQGGVMLAGLSILPALMIVIVGEVARVRSWLYYMIGGGLALGLLPLAAMAGGPGQPMPPAALWQVLATAGFAGGLVYWLLAGRTA